MNKPPSLTEMPALGIADAWPALGDLVGQAAAGTPQVLRRHKTPVAVLIPASGIATAATAADSATTARPEPATAKRTVAPPAAVAPPASPEPAPSTSTPTAR